MNCYNPFTFGGGAFGCGQCTACRINKRREWTHRLMLEQLDHAYSTFVTLTFGEDHYPQDHSVSRRDIQLFLKRLRSRISPDKVRYFAVGEYGTETGRPHYHLALFGFEGCQTIRTQYDRRGCVKCCARCSVIEQSWKQGRIESAPLEQGSMAYVCGYVTKRMTRDDDPRLEGRRPEFAVMSRRPGLGFNAMFELADTLMKHGFDEKIIDVPTQLEYEGKKKMPLGQYLRRNLRRMIGRDEKTPEAALVPYVEGLRPLREAAFLASQPFRTAILQASKAKRLQIDAREKRIRKGNRI